MIAAIHLIGGAAAGKHLKKIWLIILVALVSHYVLDFIPHQSFVAPLGFKENGLLGTNIWDLIVKSIDSIIGVSLVVLAMFLYKKQAKFIALGAFFAIIPDLLQFLCWKYGPSILCYVVPCKGYWLYNQLDSFGLNITFQSLAAIFLIVLLFYDLKRVRRK